MALWASKPPDLDTKAWGKEVRLQLDDEFGPGSLKRAAENARQKILTDWLDLARQIEPMKRALPRENYGWAMDHLCSTADEARPAEVPSRAAVHFLIAALTSKQGWRTFLSRYHKATATKSQAETEEERIERAIKKFDWLKKMCEESETDAVDAGEEIAQQIADSTQSQAVQSVRFEPSNCP